MSDLIDDKMLKKLECPFTWEMESISNYERAENPYHENDDEDYSALLRFIRKIMSVYVFTEIDDEKEKILKLLNESKKELDDVEISSHPEISTKVVEYVYYATSCFVYKKFDMTEELDEAFDKVKDVKFSTLKDESTIDACISIAWSKYHRIGSKNAEKFIREALSKNPKCDLWYFILAKNLRRQRRDNSIAARPNDEEITCFITAYQLSKNEVFELFVAQMYRELRLKNEAKKIYTKIYDNQKIDDTNVNCTVLLRLALGFIRLEDYQKAKDCLDRVEKKNPNQSMLIHYRGIYYMKKRMFKEAIPYFQKAMKEYNICADKDYMVCRLKMNRNFDITEQLLITLDKYEKLPDDQLQTIILDLGFCFWKIKNKIKEALDYFVRAVEINPDAKCFTDYYDYINLVNGKRNVYATLEQSFFPLILNTRSSYFAVETVGEVQKLQKYFEHSKSRKIDFKSLNRVLQRVKL